MKHLLPTALFSFLALATGNFSYQFMTSAPQWGMAAERSFFQFVAIAVFVGLIAPKINRLAWNQ